MTFSIRTSAKGVPYHKAIVVRTKKDLEVLATAISRLYSNYGVVRDAVIAGVNKAMATSDRSQVVLGTEKDVWVFVDPVMSVSDLAQHMKDNPVPCGQKVLGDDSHDPMAIQRRKANRRYPTRVFRSFDGKVTP